MIYVMTSAALSMIMREGQRRDQLLLEKQKEAMKNSSLLEPKPIIQSYEPSPTTPKLPKIIIIATGVAIALSAYKFGKKVF